VPTLSPLRVAAAALVVFLLLRLLQEVDWGRAAGALSRTRVGLVALAALLNLTANSAVRVARRAALLRPLSRGSLGRVGFAELAGLFFTNYAANSLLPARAGDALFVAQLHRRHGYPVATLVGAQLVEKAVEASSLWLSAWAVAAFVPLPLALAAPLYAFLGVGSVCVLLLASDSGFRGVAREAAAEPVAVREDLAVGGLRFGLRGLLGQFRSSLRLLNAPRVWSRAVFWSFASDLVDALMIGLCLIAVGIHVAPGVWLLVLLAVNFAIIVPATPGQVGALEAAAVATLRMLDVGTSEALVFALLYHAVHIVPMSLAGAISFARSSFSRRAPEAARPARL
jgi:uncharacterized protein (TIRG00374 family)